MSQTNRSQDAIIQSLVDRAERGESNLAKSGAEMRAIIEERLDTLRNAEDTPLIQLLTHFNDSANATASAEQDLDPMDPDAEPDMPRALKALNLHEALLAQEREVEVGEDGQKGRLVHYYTLAQNPPANDDSAEDDHDYDVSSQAADASASANDKSGPYTPPKL